MSDFRSIGYVDVFDIPEDEAIAILGRWVYDTLKKHYPTYIHFLGGMVCTQVDYENAIVKFEFRGDTNDPP